MPITLTVNNIPYQYPVSGDSPGWGGPATDWAAEVTLVLNELQGSTDIVQTPFAIANNISSPTNIVGLSFNTGLVRAAVIDYSVYRTSTLNPSGKAESGVMGIVYDNLASSGNKWGLVLYGGDGVSGVNFSITDVGQFQYTSTDIGTAGYSGIMRFRARSLAQ